MGLGDLLSTQHGVQLPWKRLVQGWQAGRLLKQKVEWIGGGSKAPECLDTHRAALSLFLGSSLPSFWRNLAQPMSPGTCHQGRGVKQRGEPFHPSVVPSC